MPIYVPPRGLVPINEYPITSAVAAIDVPIPAGYRVVELHLLNIKPATNGAGLFLRTSSNGGVSFDAGASDYAYGSLFISSAGTVTAGGNVSQSVQLSIMAMNNVAANAGASGVVRIFQPGDTARKVQFDSDLTFINDTGSGYLVRALANGMRDLAGDVDYIRLIMHIGNIDGGLVKVMGLMQ